VEAEPTDRAAPARGRPRIILTLLAIGVGVAAWQYSRRDDAVEAAPKAAASAVPVVVAEAAAKDVPIWLRGLGTVRAWNTVSVRPKVGGELESLAFVEGQEVAAGDLLAKIDARPYEIARDQAAAKLAQDEARLGAARRQLQSSRDLVKAKAAGQLEFDLDSASVAELEGLVRSDRAALAQAKLQIEYTKVVAPIAGRTGLRLVDAGNIVVADDARGLVVITQLEPVAVVFSVPQTHLPDLRAAMAQASPAIVEALGENDVVLATGELVLVDSVVDPQTGTIALKAKFANEASELWPGQLVDARIRVETRAGAIVVREQAIQAGVEGPFVYVVAEDGTAELRNVKPVLTQDGETIVEGLVAGDRVIIEGHAKLSPGARVTEGEAAP
jgi:multidrug efflux system membrane fusion protein